MYEFSARENTTIEAAGRWATMLGGVSIASAAGQLLQGAEMLLGSLISAAIGWLLIEGGRSLGAVVHTQGDNVKHLMTAIDKLEDVYRIRLALFVIALVMIFGGVVLGVLIAVLGAAAT